MAALVETPQARRYASEELVRMRSELPTVNFAIPKLNKHPDIAGIVRLPDEAINNPDRFSCKTQNLMESAKLLRMNQIGPKRVGRGSSEENELPIAASDQFTRDRQNTQWHLRQRDNSDRSSQPHSAPSGIAAQQSENFQRFYRAVVSPTHVRVTAGGRIVPNTRAVAPPPLEWNGDKFAFEPRTTLPESESGALPAINWPPAPLLPLGFPQLPPGGFLPPPNFLPPALPAPFGPMVSSQHLGPFAGRDQSTTEHGAADNAQNGAPTKRPIPVPQPIKISPPNQFDQSKPFMYNGQVVYPVLPGTPLTSLPMPISILGNPNFAQPSPTAGSFIPPHLSMPFPGFPQPLMASQNGQPMPVMLSPQIIGSDNGIYAPPFAPLSNSQNTMAQIQGLRGQLMHVDNQVVNSKHQADAPHMELQRNALVEYIEKMEEMHKVQLAHEQNGNITIKKSVKPTSTATSKDSQEKIRSFNVSVSTPELSAIPRPTETYTDVAKFDTQKKMFRSEPTFKSRLSAAAAMAPPFQPRAHTLPQQSQTSVSPEFSSSSTIESQSQIEHRLLSRSASDWGQGSSQTAAVGLGYVSLPKAHTMHEPSTRSHPQKQPPSMIRSSTFNGSSSILSSPPVITPQVVPYLVGAAPQGMSAGNVDSKDFVYSRPLTTEELRARHLYWGNAPRSVQKGLPKFDGKDFYPPSPMKENAQVVEATSDATPTRKRYSTPDDFENLFTERGVPGYKTPSPTRHNGSLEDMGPMFQINDYDYMSPNTHAFQSEAESFPASNHVNSDYEPSTPGAERQADFSDLFTERGVPGYRSPTPPPREASTPPANHNAGSQYIITPENKTIAEDSEGENDEVRTENSWGPVSTAQCVIEDSANEITSSGSGSTPSTVEINLTSKAQSTSPTRGFGDTFAERVANLASQEQKNMFLQNMLRNTAPMAAPALSGEVSSATAQGYLPQYRGTAAASLAPAMISNPSSERDLHRVTADQSKEFSDNLASLGLAKVLSENLPLGRKTPTLRHPSPETMGAEAYMRFLAVKTEDAKLDQLANGTGTLKGSDAAW